MLSMCDSQRSKNYVINTSKLPANMKVLSPNHCMFSATNQTSPTNRLDKFSDPYLGEKPVLPEKEAPPRMKQFAMRKKMSN